MESDSELLQKLLGTRSDALRDDVDTLKYLTQLSSMGSAKLRGEPNRLRDEQTTFQEEIEGLAFSHYKTFIEAANCSKELSDDFSIVEKELCSLNDNLPDLRDQCRQFLNSAQQASTSRQNAALALTKHAQLLEILEIPQVMDTFVKGGCYEEALELSLHMAKLQRRLSHIPIIQSITDEVQQQRSMLCNALLDQLHVVNLTLPQALKVLAYLRRLGTYNERELRILFLQARNSVLMNTLKAIDRDDAYQYVIKLIELSRTHIFDIVTQYRAVFSDDDPVSVAVADADAGRDAVIFESWLHFRIQWFLNELRTALLLVVGDRLDSVIAQTMYFGLSFGRIGADFRGLAAPIFLDAIMKDFSQSITEALDKFAQSVAAFLAGGTSNSSEFVTAVSDHSYIETGNDPLYPPQELLACAPLALFCNDVLTAFNSLRLSLPLSQAENIASCLQKAIENIQMIVDAKFSGNVSVKEKLTSLLTKTLVPYLNKCLNELFPHSVLAQLLGAGSAATELIEAGLARIKLKEDDTLLKASGQDVEPILPELQTEPFPDTTEDITNSSDLLLLET